MGLQPLPFGPATSGQWDHTTDCRFNLDGVIGSMLEDVLMEVPLPHWPYHPLPLPWLYTPVVLGSALPRQVVPLACWTAGLPFWRVAGWGFAACCRMPSHTTLTLTFTNIVLTAKRNTGGQSAVSLWSSHVPYLDLDLDLDPCGTGSAYRKACIVAVSAGCKDYPVCT